MLQSYLALFSFTYRVTRILLYWVNAVLKSLLRAFTRAKQCYCKNKRKISNEFYHGEVTIIKLEKIGPFSSSFNPFQHPCHP